MSWFDQLARPAGLRRSASAWDVRWDLPIAEDFAQVALKECKTLHDELVAVVGDRPSLNVPGMLYYAIGSTAHAIRTAFPERPERVETALARIAIAQFLWAAAFESTLNREELFEEMQGQCLQTLPSNVENLARLYAHLKSKTSEPVYDYMLHVGLSLCGDDAFDVFDTAKSFRVFQSVLGVWVRGLEGAELERSKGRSVPKHRDPGVFVDLPDSWRLRRVDPWLYSDLCSPQYTFLVTVHRARTASLESRSVEDALRSLVSANSFASEAEYFSVGETRSLAQYRTSMPEDGRRKDDYHWCLLEVKSGTVRSAFFTLSALADMAKDQSTAVLAASLRAKIAHAEFTPGHH